MKVYLSGPMAGRDWNEVVRDFAYYEKMFTFLGFEVCNPCDIKHTDTDNRKLTLLEDMDALDDCDVIFMIPGWEDAKGCNTEWGYALGKNLIVLYGKKGI